MDGTRVAPSISCASRSFRSHDGGNRRSFVGNNPLAQRQLIERKRSGGTATSRQTGRAYAASDISSLSYVTDGVVGSALLLAIARSGVKYRSRQLDGWTSSEESPEDESGDDTNVKWTVASIVGCLPLFSWVSWLLPTISLGEWDRNERPGCISQAEATLLTCAYLLAYASHGFNLSDRFTWAIAILCACHIQLERTNALLVPGEIDDKVDGGGSQLRTSRQDDIVRSLLRPGSQAEVEKARMSNQAPDFLRPPGPQDSIENAVSMGKAIGKASVLAQQFGESFAQGKLQAEIEQEALRTEEALKRESEFLTDELEAWDDRFRLRTMTRSELLSLAKKRGLRRYSKLTKPDLILLLEEDLFD